MIRSLLTKLLRRGHAKPPEEETSGEVFRPEEMNARLLAITESAHDMIATFDLRGKIMYLNRAGYELLGIRELTEKNGYLERYMSVPTTLRLVKGLRIALEQGYWQDESEWIVEGGNILATSQTVVAHKPEGADEPYFSTIVRDITDRKEIERQLLLAKQAADEANEAKSAFLARMSHEIRNPLNGIVGLTHLLKRSPLNDVQRDYVRQIAVSSNSLLHLLNDLLDYSKLEADKLTLHAVPFRLDDCLERLSGMFAVLLGPKPVELVIAVEPGVPDILVGDHARLEQVLLNLAGNAIKFTETGCISLEIGVVECDPTTVKLRFAIADTGIGMKPEQLEHLFQPFVQAGEGTSRSCGGTGLGLVICRSLIERMGGQGIEVVSRYGAGSTFAFELPFRIEVADWLSESLSAGLKVLVLEDSPVMRDHWLSTLMRMGCQAEAVADWDSAERLLSEQNWDVWIADMECGDMHGEETWDKWKKTADRRGTAILCSTTLPGRDALLSLSEASRPDGFLIKPAVRQQIVHALQGLLDRRSASVPPAIPQESAALPRLSGRVLLVEDNEINRVVLTKMLEDAGLTVHAESDGQQALRKLTELPFRLVLLDLHLPGMDGFEIASRIRADGRWHALPVIAVTGQDVEGWRNVCRIAGMNDLLRKPVHPEELFRTLSHWLSSGLQTAASSVNGPEAAWPDTEELDIPLALHRLDGKTSLYLQLLERFRQEYADLATQLDAWSDEDAKGPQRLLHSFRGAATHLGAMPVARVALALEEAYRLGRPSTELIRALEARLRCLMDIIEGIINQKRR
ncbi:response regulator [Cohnella sp. CFH 77786]|uniref:response regulator n=1 Tax=Cohnella sp. CFH 77786 TaxID=2662265 RepID=UPI001C609548|nr:response regulator [Cohnella sp. CFH 77786]MBW5448082.1 response regulator [Cohnella sp. CFH 77786]